MTFCIWFDDTFSAQINITFFLSLHGMNAVYTRPIFVHLAFIIRSLYLIWLSNNLDIRRTKSYNCKFISSYVSNSEHTFFYVSNHYKKWIYCTNLSCWTNKNGKLNGNLFFVEIDLYHRPSMTDKIHSFMWIV